MHVALIANTAWVDEELAMFKSMVVGMLAEQVRVTQVVPERLSEDDLSAFCQRVPWRDSSWPRVRKRRIAKLAGQLDDLEIDIIHALDGRLWPGALSLSEQLNLPVVLTASSMLDIPQVEKLTQLCRPNDNQPRIAIAARSKPLADALSQFIAPDIAIKIIPHGVHIPVRRPAARTAPDAPLCAVVSGNGVYDEYYETLFTSLRVIVNKHHQAQFFLDGQGSDQHQLWQAAARFGLLSNMSMIGRRLGHRELLLNADVLIHHQPLGRCRSLILQAMASGLAVLAKNDPWLDYLINDTTAWLVDEQPEHDPMTGWTGLIERAINDRQAAVELGGRARNWIKEHHLAAYRIGQLLDLYHNISNENMKFPSS